MDLAFIRRLMQSASARTMLTRNPLTTAFASWDASTEWGMGGFLDGDWYSVSWEELRSWRSSPPFFPSRDVPEKHTIAYLELFAGYWFLRKWAKRLSGWTALVFTDNTNCLSWLTRWTGPGYVIPLLRAVIELLSKHDVQLQVEWISSSDNYLSDSLSRDDLPGFLAALGVWSGAGSIPDDMGEWQLFPAEVHSLEQEFGIFT
eukprot:8278424-Pyramimonas_sp.AAC.1